MGTKVWCWQQQVLAKNSDKETNGGYVSMMKTWAAAHRDSVYV